MKTKEPYFSQLAHANIGEYIPNVAHNISPWAILEVSIKNDNQLALIVELLSELSNGYSLSWQPNIKNHNTFWIAFEDEDDLMSFRLSV